MDEYVTQKQHEEFTRAMDAKFERIEAEDKRQNERLKRTEDWQEKFSEMQVTLKQQGESIKKLTEKLNEIAEKPAKRWESVGTYAITAIISLVLGYLFNMIF